MHEDTGQYWNNIYGHGRDFTLATAQEISRFLEYTDQNLPKTCLDIGCGTGQLTRELYHRGYQCVGIDASTTAIKLAQSYTVVPENRLSYVKRDVERETINNLPLALYSLITCKLVYAFVKDKPAFLERVKQLLAPTGAFVVITPLPEEVPPEKRGIAVSEGEVKLLSGEFRQVALYRDRGLTHFVGRRGANEHA